MHATNELVHAGGVCVGVNSEDGSQVSEPHTSPALDIGFPSHSRANLHGQMKAIIGKSKARIQFALRQILFRVGSTRKTHDHGYCEHDSKGTGSSVFIPFQKFPHDRDRKDYDYEHRPYRCFRALASIEWYFFYFRTRHLPGTLGYAHKPADRSRQA